MSMVLTTCPGCHGRMEYDDINASATCIYCGTKISIPRPQGQQNNFQQPNNFNQGGFRQQNQFQHSQPAYNPRSGAALKRKKKNIIVAVAIIVAVIILISILVPVLYVSVPDNISIAEFETAANKAGFFIDSEANYDGHNTYWIGAYKYEDQLGKDPDEIERGYVIDYTRDTSPGNALVEYHIWLFVVTDIGGKSRSGSGSNYNYQMNTSSTHFGFAARIERVNILVTAEVKYKDEIIAFLNALGFGFK